jgi:hypothetical protein
MLPNGLLIATLVCNGEGVDPINGYRNFPRFSPARGETFKQVKRNSPDSDRGWMKPNLSTRQWARVIDASWTAYFIMRYPNSRTERLARIVWLGHD